MQGQGYRPGADQAQTRRDQRQTNRDWAMSIQDGQRKSESQKKVRVIFASPLDFNVFVGVTFYLVAPRQLWVKKGYRNKRQNEPKSWSARVLFLTYAHILQTRCLVLLFVFFVLWCF